MKKKHYLKADIEVNDEEGKYTVETEYLLSPMSLRCVLLQICREEKNLIMALEVALRELREEGEE